MLQEFVNLTFRRCVARIVLFSKFDWIVNEYREQLVWLEERFPVEFDKARFEYARYPS